MKVISKQVGDKPDYIQNIIERYVATIYNNEVWFRLGEDASAENEDVRINFKNKIIHTHSLPRHTVI